MELECSMAISRMPSLLQLSCSYAPPREHSRVVVGAAPTRRCNSCMPPLLHSRTVVAEALSSASLTCRRCSTRMPPPQLSRAVAAEALCVRRLRSSRQALSPQSLPRGARRCSPAACHHRSSRRHRHSRNPLCAPPPQPPPSVDAAGP
uniref:Uncharacterized protein n=1 Tax=Oryza sativa subsp. japonica TaxID=39947 RepID=Q6YTA8_ORYSJ|nr:hypothetical protein [Oryza sativa Japonica Group]BAC99949.1 hypothetical protein [Oryza sativa Japonica Group]